MRKRFILAAVVALVCATATSAVAQVGRAELRGRVTDEQGGALPGVTLVITHQDAGTFREIVTGAGGQYFVAQLIPGVFTITAELPGFRGFEQTDFALGVGMTLDLDITLLVGAIEETITVTGETPIVDLTSAEVGGTVTAGELTDLPTGNRSYFAAVALLPGIQFNPSSSLGNDNMIANGQTTNGNSVGLDGATNNDDASGTSAGGQVRVPLEAVSEFQVLTNQFDAEFGRVRGAIINSITKQGTNQFTGALFDYYISEATTAEDFFVKQSDTLTKPETNKKEFGGVVGGPIVRDKMHFLFSIERQLVAPSRSREYPTRPDLSFTLAEDWKALNTLMRLDHQINANNTWAFRWLREKAPQFNLIGNRTATLNAIQDETDNDQIWVGTYTSVLGNNKVNTVRISATSESFFRGNPCWRANGGFDNPGNQAMCPPEFEFNSFTDNQLAGASGRDDENSQWNDTFSWFVPNMGGDHDFKFGATFHRTRVTSPRESDLNGTFRFDTDQVFNPLDATTYPERLFIRVGNPLGRTYTQILHTWEAFFQDKWAINDRLTAALGVRYDLEQYRSGVTDNPFFPGGGDPIDYNNVSPRTSLAYDLTGDGKSVVRGGYGMFYDKTILGRIDEFLRFPKFSDSFTVSFPLDNIDRGPSNGMFPTEPLLLNFDNSLCPVSPGGPCPTVDRAALNAMFPPGTLNRNVGTVYFDHEGRKQPWMHQLTLGFERELAPTLSVSVDYIRTMGRDMLGRINLNPGIRASTRRGDTLTRFDAFGILGEPFTSNVYAVTSCCTTNYDALNFQLEKRYADRWGARVAYAFGSSRGNTFNQHELIDTQVGANLNLDKHQQPGETDRRHILSVSGRTELPGGATASVVARYMSGLPFTLVNDNFDLDLNGIAQDPIAAGTYSGTGVNGITVENDGGFGGARGPDFVQVDMRFGYRLRPYASNTLDVFFDIFNITDHANFNNPDPDQRGSDFLQLRTLRGGSGFPRSGQFGIRYGF